LDKRSTSNLRPIKDYAAIVKEKKRADDFEHEHFSGPHVVMNDAKVDDFVAKMFINESKKPTDKTWKPEPIKLSRQVTSIIESSGASFRDDVKKNNKK
jgi:hypothetical protein